jgi:hypothetical protein
LKSEQNLWDLKATMKILTVSKYNAVTCFKKTRVVSSPRKFENKLRDQAVEEQKFQNLRHLASGHFLIRSRLWVVGLVGCKDCSRCNHPAFDQQTGTPKKLFFFKSMSQSKCHEYVADSG